MHLCLFEERAEQFEPLSGTRPIFDLRCGLSSLADKQMRQFPCSAYGVLVRPLLAELYRAEHPELHVNDLPWLHSADTIFINGRWLPPAAPRALPPTPCIGTIGGEIAFAAVPRHELRTLTLENLPDLLQQWQHTLPNEPVGGRLLRYPWDLVERNGAQIGVDFAGLGIAQRPGKASAHLAVVGDAAQLWIDPTARVEPLVVVDTTGGPVVIDHHAVVTAFTRLEGPCYVGPRTQVFGAKIRAGTSLGPECRVGGEIEASIVHGYSNKVHDGFLGHSYVGAWVNLAAGTQNSDLRNDYGEVSVLVGGQPVRTGQNKVGCFLGDHTKTGLGTLLNTGTSAGAFCNLLPAGRYAPRYVPAFTSWWNGALSEAFTPEQLVRTAELAMRRRGVELTAAQRELYCRLHAETAPERRRVLRASEQKALRRSA
jgi:UDP-N-acetylglucosamine diphosphorylase / glucose-1-phosphate thymidylyltransferase / UDP-N-acetylgalactosamine diphosphorylase / glucosamine-1-phosphate N-acetyltransferase / galactosamine-1-phosphate N-acetyltransferase